MHPGDGFAVLFAGTLAFALAVGNGHADPVSQNIILLQQGNTTERREAVGILARVADHRATETLVAALRDDDALVRAGAEQALWSMWHRSGDPTIDARLQEGIAAMQQGAFQRAVDIFSEVIAKAPNFAEGYNKRATTYYLMQQFDKSIEDCERTLVLNPVHFGALSGAGLCYLGLRDLRQALSYFERAIAVNPNMPAIAHYIAEIKKFLRDQSL
jgi:tetratricopeptide (TPR) repeat protein